MRSSLKTAVAALAIAIAVPAWAAPGLPGAVETGALERLDAWSVGATKTGPEPMPASLWTKTDSAALSALLDQIPAAMDSPAAARLIKQALLTPAARPAESTAGAADAAARKRYESLARIGAADHIVNMVAGSGEAKEDPVIALFVVQSELARGRIEEACRRADSIVTETPSRFLLRLRALCLAVGGSSEGADLALAVARDAGAGDPWFEGATASVTRNGPARKLVARYDNSLNTAASLAGDLAPPAKNALVGASVFSLAAIASTPSAPHPLRAEAAAEALRLDAIAPTIALDALRRGAQAKTTPEIVLLVAAVDLADGMYARTEAIANALSKAKSHSQFVALSRLFASEINDLPVDQSVAPFAPVFARAHLALGEYGKARLRRNTFDPTRADPALLAILDLALVAGRGGDATAAAQGRMSARASRTEGLVVRDLKLLQALGQPIGPEAEAFIAQNAPARGRMLDAGLLARFDAAVQRQATGEAVVTAALLAGPGAHTLDPNGLAQIVAGLRAAGATPAARAIAVEGMIGGQAR
jgi:hypothetical protein